MSNCDRKVCACRPETLSPTGSNEYKYSHNVDTCACGNCHKSRVDSGTQDAYMSRVRAKVNEVLKDKQEHKPFVCQCANCKGFTVNKAAVGKESHGKESHGKESHGKESHGKQLEDAKAIFAAPGTPFDSKCPHGLPFYACMPCSH